MINKTIPTIQIGFINPETGNLDETEFDTDSYSEAMCLFHDFCAENRFSTPEILYVEFDRQ